MAGAEGFEPSTKVLETHVLPLHHAPKPNMWNYITRKRFVKDKNPLFPISGLVPSLAISSPVHYNGFVYDSDIGGIP